MDERKGEMIHRLVEKAAKSEVGKSGREVVDGTIRTDTVIRSTNKISRSLKSDMGDRRREVVDGFIKVLTEHEVSERGREVVDTGTEVS
jgi:hypothetical protein